MTFAWGQKNTFLALNDRINNEQDNEGKISKGIWLIAKCSLSVVKCKNLYSLY